MTGFINCMSPARRLRLALGLILGGLPLGGCVVEVPPGGSASGYGYTCYAGVYTCPVPQQVAVGTRCSCPGLGAPSFGTVR